MDRHHYDPYVQKMAFHHEIADEKCFPMVCHMPNFFLLPLVIPTELIVGHYGFCRSLNIFFI